MLEWREDLYRRLEVSEEKGEEEEDDDDVRHLVL